MTTFTLLRASLLDTSVSGFDFSAFHEHGEVVSGSAKKVVVGMGQGSVTFHGAGFGEFDGSGWPTTGLIHKLSMARDDMIILRMADMAMDMGLWRSLSEANDWAGLADAILGGDDVITGAGSRQILFGHGGDDLIGGLADHDYLHGAAGQDTLTGGGGKDVFAFRAAEESAGASADLITDLRDKDTIDLKRIDADTSLGGNQAFFLVLDFSGAAGELTRTYDAGTGITRIEGDTDGDGIADLAIDAAGSHATYNHFVF